MYQIARQRQRKREHTELYISYSYLDALREQQRRLLPLMKLHETTLQPEADFQFTPLPRADLIVYCLSGALEIHQEMGSTATLQEGDLCRISNGEDGAMLRVRNLSSDLKTAYLEFWIDRTVQMNPPVIETLELGKPKGFFAFRPLISGQGHEEALSVDLDLAIYLSSLRPNDNLIFETTLDRKSVVFVLDGALKLEDDRLLTGDTGLIWRDTPIELSAQQRSKVFLIDLPEESTKDEVRTAN